MDTTNQATGSENRCLNGLLLVSKFSRLVLLLILILMMCSLMSVEGTVASEMLSQDSDVPFVTFDINYHLPGAGTVYLLWGIDDWMVVPEHRRPAGTTLYKGLMYTPMSADSEEFTTQLTVPLNAEINYVFHITKQDDGAQVYIWDTNGGKDYFSVARTSGSESIALPSLEIAAERPKNHLLQTMFLLGLLVVLLAVNRQFVRIFPLQDRGLSRTAIIQVIGVCIALLMILLPLRTLTVGYEFTNISQLIWDTPKLLRAASQDVLLVSILLSVHLGLLWIFNRQPFVRRLIPPLVLVMASVAIIFSIVNIKALPLIGKPLNYQWIYYSGFLKSFDAKHAIAANLDPGLLIRTLVTILLLPVIALLTERLITSVFQFCLVRKNTAVLIVLLPAMIFTAISLNSHTPEWDRNKLENPLISFVSSIISSGEKPLLFRMKTPIGPEEFQTVGVRGNQQSGAIFNSNVDIRNVVVFILESVGARYLDSYGASHRATPHLDSYRKQSLLFSNIYAHAPATNKSMFSILSSAYPWISYRSVTEEFPDAKIPTLVGELKMAGYQTAYFSSSDLRFQSADKFLEGKGFDLIRDYRSYKCEDPNFVVSTKEWKYLDSSNDQCTAKAFSQWLPTVADSNFFTIIWTNNTHYPYFVSGETRDFGEDDDSFNLYLNALRESDEALETVIRSLENQGVTKSTLVIVVGDHGEAFGQHNQIVHASKIYDENLHVPLLLINPQLFSGGSSDKLGGLIDLAPTIMQVLGLQPADAWLGRSLLSEEQTPRIYFLAPWSELLFGYRESNSKFIYNASRGTFELFNLQTDPLEKHNISAQNPELKQQGLNQLAAWVQFQDRYIQSLSARKVESKLSQ